MPPVFQPGVLVAKAAEKFDKNGSKLIDLLIPAWFFVYRSYYLISSKIIFMRNFFKNTFGRMTSRVTRKEIAEILDTDEDRVINQYRGYLNYINNVKKELIRRSAEMVGYKRRMSTS